MATHEVMKEMSGKWKLEKRDGNFEDFLRCRQVGWFLRKMMTSASAGVEYSLSEDAATFTKITTSMGRSSTYPMPTVGEFTPKRTLSGKEEVGRIFETSGGNMIQEMAYGDTGEIAATIKHRVEDGKLKVDMTCKDITCTSVYVKQ